MSKEKKKPDLRLPYRCMKCGQDKPIAFEFVSETGVCPGCGLNAKDNPMVVGALVCIHFDPPGDARGVGKRYRACDPDCGITIQHVHHADVGRHAGSGDPGAVTCPACMDTEIYKSELGERKGWTPFDAAREVVVEEQPAEIADAKPIESVPVTVT